MVNIIESDFDVTVLAENGNNYVLGAPKNEFIHFVFLINETGYLVNNQFYIHRYELANWISKAKNQLGEKYKSFIDDKIGLSYDYSDNHNILHISYKNLHFEVDLNLIELGKTLLNDSEVLEKVILESSKKGFKKKMISALLDEYDEEEIYSFTQNELNIIAFELKVFRMMKSWKRGSHFYHLLRLQYDDSKIVPSYLPTDLAMGLDVVVGKTSCNCNHDGCFFDLLNTAYTNYFNESSLLSNGVLDDTKMLEQFTKVWSSLNAKERAVLDYLAIQFGNTPLINLYLLNEKADFEEYIYKMTFPYQPDSADDAFVRRIISIVRFYLSKEW
jgi:hypothetical protein